VLQLVEWSSFLTEPMGIAAPTFGGVFHFWAPWSGTDAALCTVVTGSYIAGSVYRSPASDGSRVKQADAAVAPIEMGAAMTRR
jgi:hypothetical protein